MKQVQLWTFCKTILYHAIFLIRIDTRRQFFHFLYKFLGITGWKRLGQSFWILIWIYYFLWITLVEYKKYLTLLLTTLNACFFQYCTISDLGKLDFIVLLIAQQIIFNIIPAWLINLINLSIMYNEINLRSVMESNYFSSSSPIYHKIIPNPVQQSRQSDPFPSSNIS